MLTPQTPSPSPLTLPVAGPGTRKKANRKRAAAESASAATPRGRVPTLADEDKRETHASRSPSSLGSDAVPGPRLKKLKLASRATSPLVLAQGEQFVATKKELEDALGAAKLLHDIRTSSCSPESSSSAPSPVEVSGRKKTTVK